MSAYIRVHESFEIHSKGYGQYICLSEVDDFFCVYYSSYLVDDSYDSFKEAISKSELKYSTYEEAYSNYQSSVKNTTLQTLELLP